MNKTTWYNCYPTPLGNWKCSGYKSFKECDNHNEIIDKLFVDKHRTTLLPVSRFAPAFTHPFILKAKLMMFSVRFVSCTQYPQ
jgi:hypothetical protein